MNRIRRKIQSNTGESIAETLVAVLLIALALTMLAAMISSTANMVKTSETKMNEYYKANAALETFAASVEPIDVAITVTNSSGVASSAEIESPKVDCISNNAFSKTPVVAYRLHPAA